MNRIITTSVFVRLQFHRCAYGYAVCVTFFQIYLIHVCRNKSAAFGFFINFYPNGPFGAVLFVKIAFCPKRTIEPAGAAAVLSLVSLVSFVAFVTFFAGVTFVAFVALFAICAVNTVCAVNACGFYAGVGFSDPPVAVFADKGGVSVRTVGAVLPIYTILTVSAVSAIRTF